MHGPLLPEKYQLSKLPPSMADFWETSNLRRIRKENPAVFEYAWIAGGAVRRALLGTEDEARPQSDIDLFFSDPGAFAEWERVCKAYTGMSEAKDKTHAREYTFKPLLFQRRVKLQAIRARWFENATALINDFDYTHCQFAIGGDWLTIGPTSLNDARRKRLVVANTRAPVAAIRRIVKYSAEGFKITDKELKKLLRSVVATPATIDAELLEEYVMED